MERVFVMFVKEERILRYAITNKISPVRGETNYVYRDHTLIAIHRWSSYCIYYIFTHIMCEF